jgi:hypothetical protein
MVVNEVANWYPEILYEESEDGISSKIPFVMVPKEEKMPILLYLFESRETGEFEPGPSGESLPIIEMDLHQYADMSVLKEYLPKGLYDQVRVSLGLEPLSEAAKKGSKITDNIRKNIEKISSSS